MRCVRLLTAQFQGRVGGWNAGYPSGHHAHTYLAQVCSGLSARTHRFPIAVRRKRRCAQSVIPTNMVRPFWPAILIMYIYIHPRMCVHMVARLVCALQGAACVSSVTSDRGRADDVRGSFHRLRLVYPEPIRNHNIHPGRGAQGELGRRDGEMEGERTRMYVCMCIHSSLLALPFL